MLQLLGGLALSDFRKNKLLTSLQTAVPAVTEIQASYMHFVTHAFYKATALEW